MAIKQAFRGDPTLKQYDLTKNFSGGINTTDVDDSVYTHQFRELNNVELGEQGLVQNRKGFGNFKVLNEFIKQFKDPKYYEGELEINDNSIYAVDVLLDNVNILGQMANYESIEEFKTDTDKVDYHLMIGILHRDDTRPSEDGNHTVTYTTFAVMNDHSGDNWSHLASAQSELFHVASSLPLPDSTEVGITGVERVKHGDKLLYNLSEINQGFESILEVTLPEYGYWEEATPTFRLISNDTAYIPNPYEVSNIGFNVLASDPTSVDLGSDINFSSIRAVYLTEFGGNKRKLMYIPENGKFRVNIIKTGVQLTADYIKDSVKFIMIDDAKLYPNNEISLTASLTVIEDGVNSGRISFDVDVNITDSKKPIVVRVEKKITTTYEVQDISSEQVIQTYDSEQEMLDDLMDASDEYVRIYAAGGSEEKATIYRRSVYTLQEYTRGETTVQVSGHLYVPELLTANNGPGNFQAHIVGYGDDNYDLGINGTIVDKPAVNASHGWVFPRVKRVDNPTVKVPAAVYRDVKVLRPGQTVLGANHLFNTDMLNKGLEPVLCVTGENDNYDYFATYATGELFGTESNGDIKVKYSTRIDFADNTFYSIIPNPNTLGLPKDLTLLEVNEVPSDFDKVTRTGYFAIAKGNNEFDYYVYNGGTTGTMSDFTYLDGTTSVTVEFVEFTYQIEHFVGVNADLKVIQPLDLSKFKMVEIGDRLCIYGGNTMWFSDLYKFDYIPEVNYIVLPIGGNDEITKIAYFRGSYLIFTNNSIYRMSGTFGTADFSITLINDSIGCISPKSVRGVNNNLLFMTHDGLYSIKQNYYMEGLENVDKVDRQIRGLIKNKRGIESLLLGEQYIMLEKDLNGNYAKTIRQYYSMGFERNGFPYVTDTYRHAPTNLNKLGTLAVSYKNGAFYMLGKGYTDFAPIEGEYDVSDYTYKMTIKTINHSLGYPTHNKKFKNLFIKTQSSRVSPVFVTVFVDGQEFIVPEEITSKLNDLGEVVYTVVKTPNLVTSHAGLGMVDQDHYNSAVPFSFDDMSVGYSLEYNESSPSPNMNNFTLGESVLGEQAHRVHKLVVSGKGKTYAIKVEQETPEMFGILDIGMVFKLGKVKEG